MGNLLLLLELQVASGGCDVAKDGAESSSWLGNFIKKTIALNCFLKAKHSFF